MNSSETQYAGFWVRVASILIDGTFISLITLLPFMIFIKISHIFLSTEYFFIVVLFFIFPLSTIPGIVYYSWFNAEGRQTIGKKIFGLLVVDNNSNPISVKQSFLRTLVFTLDSIILSIGHLLILFTKKNQTFHDLLTKSYVIDINPKYRGGFYYILIIVITTVISYGYVEIINLYIEAYSLPTSSMENTLMVGDYILIDKVDGNKFKPKPGDLVVFQYPPDKSISYIKRCIATSGQTVEIIDKKVYIDDKLVQNHPGVKFIDKIIIPRPTNKYGIRTYRSLGSRDNYGPITVPEGAYWVMGDNRDNSEDSRYWGFVQQENIIGKAGIIYFSWDYYNSRIRLNRIGKLIK
ncbi:MAG: signal peptidase I [Calditrichaceae bacterium]|nr:signal peptidase I [Calditrichaceae bacterium]